MTMINCPNCGAPVVADVCEYCGTVFRENLTNSDELLRIHMDTTVLKNRIDIQELYTSAIKAMRSYAHG